MAEKLLEFFRGDTIGRCAEEVCARNRENLRSFSIVGIVMSSFALLFCWLMRSVFSFHPEVLLLWAYFLLMYLADRWFGARIRHSTLVSYLWLLPLMAAGIVLGTFLNPEKPSITIMVFLCVLPLFILDRPWRIVLLIVATAAAYMACCAAAKPAALFVADMVDLFLFTVLGIGVNYLILRDRIQSVEAATMMKRLAETDALTGISNRGAGEAGIRSLMRQSRSGLFLLIDLDNFKHINDSYGHAVGDRILTATAACLREAFRDNDIVCRFGGDEFVIFAQSVRDPEDGERCIHRVMERFLGLRLPELPSLPVSVSIGATFFPPESRKTFEEIYREGDQALYAAKQGGKSSYAFYAAASASG